VFELGNVADLTTLDLQRALERLFFMVEQRDGATKARTCAYGSNQREYIRKEESASSTASIEVLILSALIDVKADRHIMMADILNAFVQYNMDINDDTYKMNMKIRGKLVDMLVIFDPD
jgi:hypothetical protein